MIEPLDIRKMAIDILETDSSLDKILIVLKHHIHDIDSKLNEIIAILNELDTDPEEEM